MRRILAIVASFLLAVSVSSVSAEVNPQHRSSGIVTPLSTTSPFKWTKVGGDPCNPKAGCTIEWALGKTGWPKDVVLGLVTKVKGDWPETISITSGRSGSKDPAWQGWMTWGKYSPKFKQDVVAAWPDGQYHPASHWAYDVGSTRYHLIKVRACGNWGGWTSTEAPKPATPTFGSVARLEVFEMPLGVLPIVVCDDTKQGE